MVFKRLLLFILRRVGRYVAHVWVYFCGIDNRIYLLYIMTSIHRTDLIQVTAQSCGAVLLSLTMSGVSTLSDVFRHVRESAPRDAGIVTVRLRNRTQGWTQQHNLVFRANAPAIAPVAHTQYPSLFA